ncbi:MAG: GNAT family N-acetyltransferase [Alphaproteobacteria bacterium]
MSTVTVTAARGDADLESLRALFLSYAESLGFSLCFQGFEDELDELPGAYAPPAGELWLGRRGDMPLGCVGVRPLGDGHACEMKRLYVTPDARRLGLGRRLAETSVVFAREAGYTIMRLDTIRDRMTAAEALYQSMGFRETPPYYDNPIPGAVYYARDLTIP